MLESEGTKVIARVGQQRQELQDVIRMLMDHQANVAASGPPASPEVRTPYIGPGPHRKEVRLYSGLTKVMGSYFAPQEEQQRKRLESWVQRLRVFSKEFDNRWELDQNGLFRPETKWAKLTGHTYMWRLERRLKEEIFMARRMEMMLSRMSEEEREIRLMEFQRIDFLSRAERKIYLRNQIEFKNEVRISMAGSMQPHEAYFRTTATHSCHNSDALAETTLPCTPLRQDCGLAGPRGA